MAVKIRLKRLGAIRNAQYRIVVMDSRKKRDGRAIEELGIYHPKQNPSVVQINSERVQYWLGVGAQPSDRVRMLLEKSGDWARYTGEGSAESTLDTPAARPDKKALYEAALAAAQVADGLSDDDAPKTKAKKSSKKTAEKAEEAKASTEKDAEAPAAE